MPERPATSLAARIAAEALLWALVAGTFLAVYVGWARASASSILPHLRLVASVALALACVRVLLAASPLPRSAARFASSALLLGAIGLLLLCYAGALIGLRSWGRVATWDLVASYVPQTRMLLDVLGVLPWVAAALGMLVLAALLVAAWLHARWLDSAVPVAERLPRRWIAFAPAVVLSAIGIDLHETFAFPPTVEQEPISLIFMSAEAGSLRMQSHGVDFAAAARRDAAEDVERAAYRPAAPPARRNLILIVSDALRADHMSVYGYRRETTPNLSRLVASGRARVAPAVRAACSESVCGLLSIAASRYVHQFSGRMFLLQEAVARHGYRTMMIMGGDHTNFYGLRELYGSIDSYYDASSAGQKYMNDDGVVLDYVSAMPAWDGRPVMIQFHLMSSHLLGRRREQNAVFRPAANYFFPANRMEGGSPSPKAVNFYDNGVRETDAVVMEILERLRAKGYLGDALVAVTGDHGEGLGEHGYWSHQRGVNDEMLGVPLVLVDYGPGSRLALDANPSPAQADIAPTLLHDLGLPIPRTWAGRPLQVAPFEEFAYFTQGPLSGLLDRRDRAHQWKYWEDRDSGAAHAFDVSTDPGETRDVIGAVPESLRREWRARMIPVNAQYLRVPVIR